MTEAPAGHHPPFRSHSQISGWWKCSEQFWLQRVDRVVARPGLAANAGKAIHLATEKIDNGLWHDEPKAAWSRAWETTAAEEVERSGFPVDQWFVSGRKSKAWPNKENVDFWQEMGPESIRLWTQFINTSSLQLIPEFIEAEFMADFGGVMVKGYIDRVAVDEDGLMGVVDLKTGSRVPDSNHQLGMYAGLMERTLGIRPTWGAYFMTRKGILTPPVNLDVYTDERLNNMVLAADDSIRNGRHFPNPSGLCSVCGVQEYCWAWIGEDEE